MSDDLRRKISQDCEASSIVGADRMLREFKFQKFLEDITIPENIVIHLGGGQLSLKKSIDDVKSCKFLAANLEVSKSKKVGLLNHVGLGAPALAFYLELLIAGGAKWIVTVGTAGALEANRTIGDLLICEEAISGEGTSLYYGAQQSGNLADENLFRAAMDFSEKSSISLAQVKSYTTDAIFRETPGLISFVKDQGAQVIEMESSALYGIAKFREIAALSLFVVSDQLSGGEWQVQWRGISSAKEKLLKVALGALQSYTQKHDL